MIILVRNRMKDEDKKEDEILTVYEHKSTLRLRLIDVEYCEEKVTMNCKCRRGVVRQL
jgi:hypothetical protein